MYNHNKGIWGIVEAVIGSIDINATTFLDKSSQSFLIAFPRAFSERWVIGTNGKGYSPTDFVAFRKRRELKEQLTLLGIKTTGTGYEESLYFYIPTEKDHKNAYLDV